MKTIINFLLLILIMIFIPTCKGEDKLKLELIHKIMDEPEKIDSLVINSNFYNEDIYNKVYNNVQEKTEIIEYVNKYKAFGYSYGGNKIFSLRRLNSNETEKVQYILITFDNQKIGIIFVFLYNELNNKWYFENWGAFTNTLEYL